MKFFITEEQRKEQGGSCYFEFQKGQPDPDYKFTCWKSDSLLMHMDTADKTALYKMFEGFDYYGVTVVDREKWESFRQNADKELLEELNEWAEENFREYDYFVIIGL
ncbi:MAG: hypothetical protein IJ007_09615 [Oscillospiraceae bacterium]|nr:hypothetical protein [Oscillospiraceae bacterium]